MELAAKYNPSEVEDKWYQHWISEGYFNSKPNDKEAYTILIPPPNVTGVLHMGHMLNNTIQDVLIRKARMDGKNACWVPGMDHASIATEAKVVKKLAEEGIQKKDLSREEFLTHAWEWKEKYGGIILEQLKKLGASCDWNRSRFTMEEELSKSVTQVFIQMHKEGLIYRGTRIVNWDPKGKTTLSDEEVIHKEVNSKLYYLKYKIEGSEDYLQIATTRPETIMGDVAACVHPDDERYKHLAGKKVIIPLVNKTIPIIQDEYIDLEFGTGVLKVTPAHDINDYNIGQKHNLPNVDVLNDDGTIAEIAGLYVGMDRFACRKQIAKDLDLAGLLEKVEDLRNKVGHSERTDAVIEQKISTQWFVDMQEFMKRNPEVLSSVMDGEIKFYPEKFKNTYRHWIENIKDWNISRQLWWGHRIPAWYAADGSIEVAETKEEAIALFDAKGISVEGIYQDEDVLDTWFSSWLWPMSVFNGITQPDNEDINYYFPTNDLVTGPDIIFFWVARMIMAGYHFKGQKPFNSVYFTGIVRDKQRRKMSKQLGNSPDALKLIEEYGADSMRMGVLLSTSAGNDILFDISQVEQGRNFCSKIWNAFRLIQSWNTIESPDQVNQLKFTNEWFTKRLNEVKMEVDQQFADYRLNDALMHIYKLIWGDFCSWYLEMIKPNYGESIDASIKNQAILFFNELMTLLHPFMPFITEELNAASSTTSLVFTPYPQGSESNNSTSNNFMTLVSEIRNLRNQKKIGVKEMVDIIVITQSAESYKGFEAVICKIAKVNNLAFNAELPEFYATSLAGKDEIFMPMDASANAAEEIEKAQEEIKYLQGFLKSVGAKLNNEKFVANANPAVVEKERQKQSDAELKIKSLQVTLSKLQASV
jgi:valyl-tRNA synthetase